MATINIDTILNHLNTNYGISIHDKFLNEYYQRCNYYINNGIPINESGIIMYLIGQLNINFNNDKFMENIMN